MRRPTAAVAGVFLGTVLLIGAKVGARTPSDVGVAVTEAPDESAPQTPAASVSPEVTGQPSRSPTAHRSTRPRRSAAPSRTQADDGLRSGTFSGGTIQYKYGSLRVTITVSGGRITDVPAAHEATSKMSAEINADALPKLRREALAAQSARIATVSGATYTSSAYRTSLQGAIDRAGG